MSYFPAIYRKFQEQFPEIAQAYEELAGKCHDWGPLDEKTRCLLKLGVAIGLCSKGGVRSHARQALGAGVTADELRHATLLALTTAGFPTTIAAMKWVDDVIEKHQ